MVPRTYTQRRYSPAPRSHRREDGAGPRPRGRPEAGGRCSGSDGGAVSPLLTTAEAGDEVVLPTPAWPQDLLRIQLVGEMPVANPLSRLEGELLVGTAVEFGEGDAAELVGDARTLFRGQRRVDVAAEVVDARLVLELAVGHHGAGCRNLYLECVFHQVVPRQFEPVVLTPVIKRLRVDSAHSRVISCQKSYLTALNDRPPVSSS